MQYSSLDSFLTQGRKSMAKGPIALIFIEDDIEVRSTLEFALSRQFKSVICFAGEGRDVPDDLGPNLHLVRIDMLAMDVVTTTVNAIIEAAPGIWMYYGFNAEYLFYPFCETRSIGEATAFVTEERRDSILTFVVDAYAHDLNAHPNAVNLDSAMIDKAGYYALMRGDAASPEERQLDFHGGLRWRFEEHIPKEKRRIDRVSLFKSKPGLRLREDHTFNDPEYNTYQCPWHHSMSASLVSFRTAKALKRNPGSKFDITTFAWPKSEPFSWNSQQLLDLGLMETGQWF